MRILFITHYFPPEGNAPATRVHAMCKRWVDMGHDVTVITCAPNVPDGQVYAGYKNKLYQRETIDGINVVRVWTYLAANKGTLLRTTNFVSFQFSAILASIFQKRPDVVIATSPQFFCGWAGVFASWLKLRPFILEIRDIWPASIAAVGAAGMAPGKRRWLLRTLEWVERMLYRSAKHIVTVGECYKQDLLQRNVPDQKISVITNGVDVDRFKPSPPDPALRERHGLTEDHLVVSYIGTVGMASGLGVVLRAAKQYKQQGEDRVRFLIVGDGAICGQLKQEAKELELNNVIFAGKRPKEEMSGYLSITDVCLVHLIKRDLFKSVLPSKIFEATSMKRPIILGVEGFAANLIRESGAGVCIEPDNEQALIEAIGSMINAPKERAQMGQNGYDYFVPRYGIDDLATRYATILHAVAAKKVPQDARLPAIRPDTDAPPVALEAAPHAPPRSLDSKPVWTADATSVVASTVNDDAVAKMRRTFEHALPEVQVDPALGVSFESLLAQARPGVKPADRPTVCIQGLGHVGAAMAIAAASARDEHGELIFNVVGIELDNEIGREKIQTLNDGQLPFSYTDKKLHAAVEQVYQQGNLVTTSDPRYYGLASFVLVDVPFDVLDINGSPYLPWDGFKAAIRTIGDYLPQGALVLVETTVPPGACEKVAAPVLAEQFRKRGLPEDGFLLAHSYERVMPGPNYYDSIVNFWRVFAGYNEASGDAAQALLERIIDTDRFPMTRLKSMTASETAKVLENSYRAMNIAFIEEWARFSEASGIDLFEIITAIRSRPTHNNIRQPGFGVGGYCLTKDPLMAKLSSSELFGIDADFPFCEQAVKINNAMPIVTLDYIDQMLGGLEGKRILLMGVSYRPDVGDTRYSPSEIFYREADRRGAELTCHDPLLTHWREIGVDLPQEIPSPHGFDAVVFGVAHREYTNLDLKDWLAGATPVIYDSNKVLTPQQQQDAADAGCEVRSIGRGDHPTPSPAEVSS